MSLCARLNSASRPGAKSCGEVHALADALEELRAAHVLELFDLQGNGRMRQMQFFGRPRE